MFFFTEHDVASSKQISFKLDKSVTVSMKTSSSARYPSSVAIIGTRYFKVVASLKRNWREAASR